MKAELKSDMISVRVSPEVRMKLKDMSDSSGYNISTIVSAAVVKLQAEVYDEDGHITNIEAIQITRKLRDCISDGFVSLSSIIEKCKIPRDTINTWIRRGMVEKVRIGNKPYIRLSNIEKLAKDRYVKKNKRCA